MHLIYGSNVNQVYAAGLRTLRELGVQQDSRNGPVLVLPAPMVTWTDRPNQRVLFDPVRDANPFFHLFEALWMLAGRHDIEFPARFNKRFMDYSDDGTNQHGAYGRRWRRWFQDHQGGIDQLDIVVEKLRANPLDRRIVVQMWDAEEDLLYTGVDVPCNTQLYLRIVDSCLQMTVMCRSNDAIWGAHGANAVHFSMLQEYLAARIGVGIADMYQLSNNYHAYLGVLDKVCPPGQDPASTARDHYSNGRCEMVPLLDDASSFDSDLRDWLRQPQDIRFRRNSFFATVAAPLYCAWELWKEGRIDDALRYVDSVHAQDWRIAAREWLMRRRARRLAAALEKAAT